MDVFLLPKEVEYTFKSFLSNVFSSTDRVPVSVLTGIWSNSSPNWLKTRMWTRWRLETSLLSSDRTCCGCTTKGKTAVFIKSLFVFLSLCCPQVSLAKEIFILMRLPAYIKVICIIIYCLSTCFWWKLYDDMKTPFFITAPFNQK